MLLTSSKSGPSACSMSAPSLFIIPLTHWSTAQKGTLTALAASSNKNSPTVSSKFSPIFLKAQKILSTRA